MHVSEKRTRLVNPPALAFESIIRTTANTKRTGQRLRDCKTHILWSITKMMSSYMRQIIYFRDLEGYRRLIFCHRQYYMSIFLHKNNNNSDNLRISIHLSIRSVNANSANSVPNTVLSALHKVTHLFYSSLQTYEVDTNNYVHYRVDKVTQLENGRARIWTQDNLVLEFTILITIIHFFQIILDSMRFVPNHPEHYKFGFKLS